ncbi:MobF family relaxase [Planotetraspora thailandica]|nr:MobF family relaxase [Planotetraspora thailandica]
MTTGYDPGYLARTAGGAENYYLSATGGQGGGEPAGRWTGRGCADLGLVGEVDADEMTAIYAHLLDPRDPEGKATLGKAPRTYRSADEVLADKLKAEPDASPERIKALTLEASKNARSAVLFHDATFSPAKSVSLLHAGFQAAAVDARAAGDLVTAEAMEAKARTVWDAVEAGSQAALDFLQDEAGYSRTGYHGAIPRDPVTGRQLADHATGRFVEAHDWVVASFSQHTNRNGDPQLHVHNAILNRVECPDGQWRTIDSRGMRKARPAAAAIGERVMGEQLTRTLGVEFATRPDGKAREIVGIDEATRDLFSSRRATIQRDVATLVTEYEAKHGHSPSRRALFQMAQYVTLDSKTRMRKGKEEAPREISLAGWEAQARAAELGALADIPGEVAGRVDLAEARHVAELADQEIQRVLETAIAEVQEASATWNRYQLTAAINRALPDQLGGLPADTVRKVLVDLTNDALDPASDLGVHRLNAPELVATPDAYVREDDGRSVFEPHERGLYTTRKQLDVEEKLIRAGAELGAPALDPEMAAAALGGDVAALAARLSGAAVEQDGSGVEQGSADAAQWVGGLRDDQAAAVHGVLTSGRRIDVLVGPAGAGKSRAMGELSTLWREQVEGKVVGLAVSQNAAEVLQGEGCDRTRNIAMFLTRVRTGQERIGPRDLIVVDEASMATSRQLAEINRIAEQAGAKLLLTGDPEQLAAVGDAGAFAMLAREHGYYQLTQVQRMSAEWEREASLAMRRGEVSALEQYDKHGRLLEGTAEEMSEQAYRRWLADHLEGKSSLLLSATKDQVTELAARAQADLRALGLVQDDGITLREATAGRGDLIMARQNHSKVTDEDGRRITNRDVLRIEELAQDDVKVRRLLGRDAATGEQQWSEAYPVGKWYLEEHAELAYASTVHAAQGRTVDTCHSLVGEGTGRSMLYVMMTRGREGNYAYVSIDERTAQMEAGQDAAPELAEAARRAERDAGPVPTPEAARAAAGRIVPDGPDAPRLDRFAVLAEAITTDEAELTATETLRDEYLRAGHLGHLGAIHTEVVRDISEARYAEVLEAALTPDQWARFAGTEDRGPRGTLYRLLRSAELAGHDAAALVERAVHAREIDDPASPAESIASVLHHRVRTALGTDEPAPLPVALVADRTPTHGPAELVDYARELATVMDARAAEIGERVAQEAPAWAIEHLGPVPADPIARQDWAARAGVVEAFREQYDRLSLDDAIGYAPDSPEARASWHAAYVALGRPEAELDVASRTDGELWLERAAYARAAKWAPQYVADDLRDTTVASDRARADAVLTAQEAAAELDPARRELLEGRARAHESLAGVLEDRRRALEFIDEAREAWHAETEQARQRAAQADQELRRRHPEADLPPIHQDDERADDRTAEPVEVERDEPMRGQLALDIAVERDDQPTAEQDADRGVERDDERAEDRTAEPVEVERDAVPVRQDDERAAEVHEHQGELDLGIGVVDGRQVAADLVAAAEAAKVTRKALERQEAERSAADREELERRDAERAREQVAVRQEPQRRLEDERVPSFSRDEPGLER